MDPTREGRAVCCLRLGLEMEDLEDFAAAVRWYSKGVLLEPLNGHLRYFLNNNLGYSLNQLGQFAEAEGYCRSAIGIDGCRHNAYKNLGVSLTGQKLYAEASGYFVKAIRAFPLDRRGLLCLERLLAERPELLSRIPSLQDDLNECRELDRSVRRLSAEELISRW
jgi:tetratricopeptide (TPR) repeat protein